MAECVVLRLLALLVAQKQFHEAVEPRGHGDAQRRLPDLLRNGEDLPARIQASTSYSLPVSQSRISSLASTTESGFDIVACSR